MHYDPCLHRRRSIRLPSYDYGTEGAYFLTLCTQGRMRLFGEIRAGTVHLSKAGRTAHDVWLELPVRFPCIRLDECIVMPDHVHGILVIAEPRRITAGGVGAIHESPLQDESHPPTRETSGFVRRRRMLIPMVVGYYKMNVARRINAHRGTPGVAVWQRNYRERVLRGERDLETARRYVRENPLR